VQSLVVLVRLMCVPSILQELGLSPLLLSLFMQNCLVLAVAADKVFVKVL
jgi:hypothetical protein